MNSDYLPTRSLGELRGPFDPSLTRPRLRRQPYLLLGFFAGFLASLLAVGLWQLAVAATGSLASWMAPLAGLLIAGAVRLVGRSRGFTLSLSALVLTIATSSAGLILAACALHDSAATAGVAAVLRDLRLPGALDLVRSSLGALDHGWCAIAAALSWLASRRR